MLSLGTSLVADGSTHSWNAQTLRTGFRCRDVDDCLYGKNHRERMTDYTVYFNGNWVSLDQVLISPMDRGFLVGDVVFEVERTFNGKSFKLKEQSELTGCKPWCYYPPPGHSFEG